MKTQRHIISAAYAATTVMLAGVADTASAQSSLTVFGVVDSAVRSTHTSGAGSVTSLISGGYSSSRFGFRGQEDLGGGLSASFWLESFLSTDTGATTPAGFQRRATLSLASRAWGELRLGRDFTPTHSSWARFDPFNYVGLGAVQLFALSAAGSTPVTAAFGSGPNSIQRASNAIQYLLPRNAWGLEGSLMKSFRENGLAANDQHSAFGGRLGVRLGPVYLSAAGFDTRDDRTVSVFRDRALAASWDAGAVKLSAGVRRYAYQSTRQNNYLLAAVVPLGAHDVKLSFNRASLGGSTATAALQGSRADQLALGYAYHLSRRTTAYATLAAIRNQGNARFVVPGAPAGTAGARSRGFEFGMNHEF